MKINQLASERISFVVNLFENPCCKYFSGPDTSCVAMHKQRSPAKQFTQLLIIAVFREALLLITETTRKTLIAFQGQVLTLFQF